MLNRLKKPQSNRYVYGARLQSSILKHTMPSHVMLLCSNESIDLDANLYVMLFVCLQPIDIVSCIVIRFLRNSHFEFKCEKEH